jgi:MoxR-like ATPase
VFALSQGRTYIIPEDVKALAGPVFGHRIQLAPDAAMRGATGAAIVADAFEQVPVPLPASAA